MNSLLFLLLFVGVIGGFVVFNLMSIHRRQRDARNTLARDLARLRRMQDGLGMATVPIAAPDPAPTPARRRARAEEQLVPLVERNGQIFIRRVSAEQKASLAANALRYDEDRVYAANEPRLANRGVPGIFIAPELLETVCAVLNCYVLARFPSELAGAEEVVVRAQVHEDPELAQFDVRFVGALPGASEEELDLLRRVIRETILPSVKRNINIYEMYGSDCDPTDTDEDLHIFIESAPAPYPRTTLPERLAGYPTDPNDTALCPTEQLGVPLIDHESNYTYGESVGKCVYFYLNPLATTGMRLAVLANLIEQCVPELDTLRVLTDVIAAQPDDGLPQDNDVRVLPTGLYGHKREAAIQLIREILLRGVNQNVYIRDCRGAAQERPGQGAFHILYNAKPQGWPENAPLPTGVGCPITLGSQLLGELFDNVLYIFGDVLNQARSEEVLCFAQVLLSVRRLYLARHAINGEQLVTGQYTEVCHHLLAQEPHVTVDNVPRELAQADQTFQTQLTAAREAELESVRLDAFPEEELGKEFDDLHRVAKVRTVTVTENELIVDTDMIFCTDPRTNRVHRIGCFKIHIPVQAYNNRFQVHTGTTAYLGGPRFVNQTQRIGGFNAPHVNGSGQACLGNVKDLFPLVIQKREYATAVQLAIAFLESVNVNDAWGAQISNWPVERWH